MSCNIVINQQTSLPVLNNAISEAKVKDPKRVEAARKGRENYVKKLKDRLLKDNKMVQMTLKESIDYFQQDLNDSGSILTAMEETICVMKEEHNTEINISIGMIKIHEINTLSESIGLRKNYRRIHGPISMWLGWNWQVKRMRPMFPSTEALQYRFPNLACISSSSR